MLLKNIARSILALLVFQFFLLTPSLAQKIPPPSGCSISGNNPVNVNTTQTYTLNVCSATSWTVSCGTIESSTSTSVTITFDNLTCGSAVITAVGSGAPTKTITINTPALTGGTISNPTQTISYNSTPAQINASAATGGTGVYSYQWYSSTDNITFSSISGAHSQNYQPPALTSTMYYKRNVTSGLQSTYTSNTATVTVTPQLTPGAVSPTTQDIFVGDVATSLSGTSPSGGNCSGSYTYTWEYSTDNINFTTTGVTTANYSPGSPTMTTYYRRKVVCATETVYSNTAIVNVHNHLTVGGITPGSINIAFNTSPGLLSAIASGGMCGSYAYQWFQSVDNVNWTAIPGATISSYNPGNLISTQYYKLRAICGSETAYSVAISVSIGNIACTDMNFVQIRNIEKPLIIDTVSANQLGSVGDAKQVTQYFDGLGRIVQSVAKKNSLVTNQAPTDLVTINLYDPLGRESYKLLPYVSTSSSGNFKCSALSEQYNFNAVQYSNEQYYYGMTAFEPSPLNRILETYAPGNNWVGSASQGNEVDRHSIKNKYWVNTVTDSVRIWNVTDNSGAFGTYTTGGVYTAGSLYKNAINDERNNQVIEFKDKEGKVILKKVQLTSSSDDGTGRGHSGWLCTYYIYDAFNHLRAVIQPRGVELLLAGGWSLTTNLLNEQCFRYEYDYRGRMIMKRIPGAGTVYMIYDGRDRLVMTQDSITRSAHKWLYTLYDSLNRPTITGLITDNTNYNNPSYHWTNADASASYPNVAAYTDEQLTKTFYDDYAWRGSESNPLSAARSTTYDSYLQTPSNTTWPYPESTTTQSSQLRNMVTGTKTKVLGTTNTYLYTVSFYDDKARIIQTQSTNVTGDSAIVTTQYGFTGKPLLTIAREGKAVSNSQTSIVLSQMTYDSLMRIIKIEKKVSNTKVNSGAMPSSWRTVSTNEYDALGQLRKKNLGAAPLDSLVYEYNIRGWLLGANRSYVKDTTSTTNWFGFDLGYDKTSFTVNGTNQNYAGAQFNGNITGTMWRSTGDDQLRKYDFTYDAVNRLTNADFNQFTGSSFSKTALVDFSVTGLTYDANGNILTMNQKGWKLGGSVTIDSLAYSYYLNANRLKSVWDKANDTATKLGDFRSSKAYWTSLGNHKDTTATDYVYDGNGSLTTDNNKDISFIHYNYLNLPDSIVVTGKGNIKYVYDAAGNKLKKITTEGSKVTTTIYMFGNFVNDTLQFLPQEEGRVRFNVADTTLQYDYFIKDHLGNVRMILTEQQKTDAYPAATLETANLTTERLFYSKIDSGRVNKSTVTGYPIDNYTNPNDYIQKLNGNGVKVGTGIVLKVMAGDKFNLRVSSWWSGSSPGTPVSPLNDIVAALAGGIASVTAGGHPTSGELTGSGVLTPNVTNFLNSQTYNSSKPKAFVNWVLFDERFNYVAGSSGFDQVDVGNTFKVHTFTNLPINKSGYLYVYVSNETPNIDVFFDNLQVTHIRGPLIEETYYYPFGLTMSGISSKALNFGDPGNKYKYNSGIELENKEFSDGSGLELYDATFRMYDPQIGRFNCIDALSSTSPNESPFTFAINNPLRYVDPLGLDTTTSKVNNGKIQIKTDPQQGDVLKIVNANGNISYYTYDPNNPDANSQGYVGAGIESKDEQNVTVTTSKKKTGVPPWLLIAQNESEQGIRRNGDGTNNPRVMEYLHSVVPRGLNENTPWCAGFVNWTLHQAGIPGDNSLYAMNFRTWGQELNNPALGAIVVFNHHVGFVAGINADGRLVVLGGNQGPAPNGVNYGTRSASTVLPHGYRLPNGYTPNYNLPKYNIHGHVITFQNTR